MKGQWTKSLALMTMVTFLAFVPGLQARPSELREQGIYAEAFRNFVKTYEGAADRYQRQGPDAFLQAMDVESPSSDRDVLRKVLGSIPPLPKLSSDQALLIMDAMKMGVGVHTIEVSNVDDGLIIVDGNPVEFDPAKADLETIANKIEAGFDKTTVQQVSFWTPLQNLLIPQAHAAKRNVLVWGLMGALGAMGLKWAADAWGKRNNGAGSEESLRAQAEAQGLSPDYKLQH